MLFGATAAPPAIPPGHLHRSFSNSNHQMLTAQGNSLSAQLQAGLSNVTLSMLNNSTSFNKEINMKSWMIVLLLIFSSTAGMARLGGGSSFSRSTSSSSFSRSSTSSRSSSFGGSRATNKAVTVTRPSSTSSSLGGSTVNHTTTIVHVDHGYAPHFWSGWGWGGGYYPPAVVINADGTASGAVYPHYSRSMTYWGYSVVLAAIVIIILGACL